MISTSRQAIRKSYQWLSTQVWLLPILIIIVTYWRLPFTYFAQDEWLILGEHYVHADLPMTRCFAIQRPLTCFLNSAEAHYFGAVPWPYALLSLTLFGLIVLIFYLVLRQWQVDPLKAAFATSVFTILSAGSQAVTWFAAFSASLPSYLFGLLAILFLLKDIAKPTRYYQVLTITMLLLALFFKEEAIWLGVVLPTTYVCYSLFLKKQLRRITMIRYVALPLLVLGLFVGFEMNRQLHNPAFRPLFVQNRPTQSYLLDIAETIVLSPVYHLGHLIVPQSSVIVWATKTKQTVTYVSIVIFILFASLVSAFLWFSKRRGEQLLVCWLFIWAFAGFMAYAVAGHYAVPTLESRYYFPSQAPVAALLLLIALGCSRGLKPSAFIAIPLLTLLLAVNWLDIHDGLYGSVKIGQLRQSIIRTIVQQTGPLPPRAAIFTDVTDIGYAGSPVAILPFLSGPGYLFQIVYFGKNQNYRSLLQEYWLWDIYKEGYDEKDGVGFGYFRSYDQLLATVNAGKLSVDQVFAFHYDKQKTTNITAVVRQALTEKRASWH